MNNLTTLRSETVKKGKTAIFYKIILKQLYSVLRNIHTEEITTCNVSFKNQKNPNKFV